MNKTNVSSAGFVKRMFLCCGSDRLAPHGCYCIVERIGISNLAPWYLQGVAKQFVRQRSHVIRARRGRGLVRRLRSERWDVTHRVVEM